MAKSKAKSPKRATKAKTSKKKPVKKPAKSSPPKRPRAARASTAPPPVKTEKFTLGDVAIPSGKLAIFDLGLVGYLPREALEPAMVMIDVPTDRALPVVGTRVGKGRFANCWDNVAVVVSGGVVTHHEKLGEAGIDFARVACMDLSMLDNWQHEDSLDGKADLVISGREARDLASAMRAKPIPGGYGWLGLPVAEAEAKSDECARLKSEAKWNVAFEVRPHSNYYYALEAARGGSGTLDIDGARLCLFSTTWGEGVFPIYRDLDHHDHVVQIRIQLAPPT